MGVVAKRSSMTFFSDNTSQYSHRVRIVLAEKGVTVDLIEADAAHPPAELADLNPYNNLVDSILHSRSDNVVKKATKELRESLMGISPIFAEKPFFMSEEFTLVDCCLAPILWRLPSLSIDIRSSKQSKPLLAYMDSLFNRDSFQESLTEQEREMRL